MELQQGRGDLDLYKVDTPWRWGTRGPRRGILCKSEKKNLLKNQQHQSFKMAEITKNRNFLQQPKRLHVKMELIEI